MKTNSALDTSESYTLINSKENRSRSTEAQINKSGLVLIHIDPQLRNETEEDKADEYTYPGASKETSRAEACVGKQYKKEVDGIVLSVEDVSVNCEIYLENNNGEIILPKSLFPENVYYGMPISLSLDESSGIRRPVIKVRHLSHEAVAKGKEEMDALVSEL